MKDRNDNITFAESGMCFIFAIISEKIKETITVKTEKKKIKKEDK